MSGNLSWTFYVTVATTVVGASFQFYSYAVLNTTQENLESWINSTYLDRRGTALTRFELTLFWSFTVSILAIGGLTGSLITRWVSERFGRRNGLILNGIFNVLGGGIEAATKFIKSPECLMIGRLILGVNIGLSCGLAPMYLTEIAPIRYRGAVGATHQILAAFGDWFCMVISLPMIFGSEQLWPLALSFPAIPALLLCIILPFCPESPRYLLLKRRDRDGAYKSARKLLDADGCSEDAINQYLNEIQNSESQSSEPGGLSVAAEDTKNERRFWSKPEFRMGAGVVFVAMVAQQFTGIAAVLSYSSSIFQSAGLTLETSQLATAGVGFCYFACTVPAIWLIESLGRRFLMLMQLIGCLVSLILLSMFISLNQDFGFGWAAYGTIGVLAVFMCIYGVGSPIPWLIASEIFTQRHRSIGVAIGTFTSFTTAFLVATLFLPFQEAVGPSLSFIPFILGLALCIIFLILYLPETRNRNTEDIALEFNQRRPYLFRHTAPNDLQPLLSEKKCTTDQGTIPPKSDLLDRTYGAVKG